MTIALITHPDYATHDTGEHPERAERWHRTWALLEQQPVAHVTAPKVSPEILRLVHPDSHSARIAEFCRAGGGRIDEDTVASTETYEVALLSAGGAVEGVRQVLAGEAARSVVLSRPPGHHALEEETMGFCFFNNVAVAARYAQSAFGLKKVAILDWDLHHGNGTEAIFYRDPSVLYMSTHQDPNWPGTGAATDIGEGPGLGATVNIPLPLGTGDAGYERAFKEVFEPVMRQFAPELLVISAGYDAHWRDPLGRMGLTVDGFARLTRLVMDWADALCQGRLVVVMEGGYDLDALSQSMLATVDTMRGETVTDPLGPSPYKEPEAAISRAIAATKQALGTHYTFS
jgi:acetoin utilization deacetylase AcuC-like enzyme